MEKDYLTERLKFLTELFKLLWLTVLGISGGVIGMALGPFSVARYLLAGAGMVLDLTLLALVWLTHRKMQYLWRELRRLGDLR